ncbi:hypothetical protein VCSRO41_3114 [Vibrio cholerae]|nr:hypothetical protein VCSRO103_1706 [Vibrio cholerae]GHZ75485.1 hypothetical protein VCSRO34_0984 [Vibrio cholerae]GIA95859.1 hypothetical protein VCSRO41_3114 [Vibrio cholerae]
MGEYIHLSLSVWIIYLLWLFQMLKIIMYIVAHQLVLN